MISKGSIDKDAVPALKSFKLRDDQQQLAEELYEYLYDDLTTSMDKSGTSLKQKPSPNSSPKRLRIVDNEYRTQSSLGKATTEKKRQPLQSIKVPSILQQTVIPEESSMWHNTSYNDSPVKAKYKKLQSVINQSLPESLKNT